MNVFHGSDTRIEIIDLSQCKNGRDFGRGFYVTNIRRQAEEMATRVAKWTDVTPYVTEFDFDEFSWEDRDLKVLRFESYTEAWLDFIVQNRKNKSPVNTHDFDMVEGPVADDTVTVRIGYYLRGWIERNAFLEELKFKRPSHQICFCTLQSLQTLSPAIGFTTLITHSIEDALAQQLMSDKKLPKRQAVDLICTSQTFAQLSDLKTGLHKKTWQEVYELLKLELKLP